MGGLLEIRDYKPQVNEIVATLFEDHDFSFYGEKITALEVFEDNGFFPVIAEESILNLELLGFDKVKFSLLDDPCSLMGKKLVLPELSASEMVLFTLQSIIVSKKMFGDNALYPKIHLESVFGMPRHEPVF